MCIVLELFSAFFPHQVCIPGISPCFKRPFFHNLSHSRAMMSHDFILNLHLILNKTHLITGTSYIISGENLAGKTAGLEFPLYTT